MSYHLFTNGDFEYVLESLDDQFAGADVVVPYSIGYNTAYLYEVLYHKRGVRVASWNKPITKTIMVLTQSQKNALIELRQISPQESKPPLGFDFK